MTRMWTWRWRYSGSAWMSWTEVRGKDERTKGEPALRPRPIRLSVFPSFRPLRPTRAGSQADPRPPLLLLPRDVPPPGHQRPLIRRLVARWGGARLLDAGHALAPAARHDGGGPAHRRPRLRLPAGLVAGRADGGVHELP